MPNYTLDFFFVTQYLDKLLHGLWISLELTIGAILIGLVAGFIVCLLALSRFRLLAWLATGFIEFFRCTPALIQIVWFFYCVPILFNVYLEPMTMGLLALGLNCTAFNAEAYRAAIQGIPASHHDACTALGIKGLTKNLYVILPQALRSATPVLLTVGIMLFQQSALVSLVAIEDLMYEGKILSTLTYRPIETFTTVALIYFLVSFPFTRLVGHIERRSQRGARI
uniref:amino acid ABC transporter permease n=1 Tax=Castellaniella defragrans TaxID=75697 RepID=UPI003341AD12